MSLTLLGYDVYAIEPNQEAVKVSHLKATIKGINKEKFVEGVAEKLPFKENFFDLVICWTVIEHVQDVKASIKEMIRVTASQGKILILTPDYRQFYEPHYKMTIPMFLPKWMVKLWLMLNRRPTAFFKTLQFVNSKELLKIFQSHQVYIYRVFEPIPNIKYNLQLHLINWLRIRFDIHRDQYWILQKLK